MNHIHSTPGPARLPRSQSFFGIHFDFHAQPTDPEIGKNPIGPTLDRLLRRVRPDYVQCDCKGHPGWSSYPTKVGYAVPGIHGDPLRIWRRVTAKHGVSLYMHFSGVYDNEAVKRHPSWARVDENGKRDPKNTSVFGPYVDKHLIPQLRELRDVYGVDGYWLDGECWATERDYSKKALQEFRRQTGIRTVPRKPGDPHYFEFTEFCREGFRRYVRHYVDAIHRLCPGVEVTSNWTFSSFMPEPVTASVDYLSGDYNPIDSVNSARMEGRCLMHQGKPWDLMAWSFGSVVPDVCRTSKPVAQLQCEAAAVLALGGGFQMYFTQRRDGTIRAQHLDLMEKVAAFCRERQLFCHKAESVPQVALLCSTPAMYRSLKRVFAPWNKESEGILGTLFALLNNQFHVDVLSEHHLKGRMSEFPLIVVPEWDFLEKPFRRELVRYVREGGKLLVTGPKAISLFAFELGISIEGKAETKNRWLTVNGQLAGLASPGVMFQPGKGTKVVAHWHEADDLESPAHPAAVTRKLGKGEITGLAIDFGARYRFQKTSQARAIFGALAKRLFPNPIVKVEGSHEVDVVVMKKGGELMVNLLNISPPHDNREVYTFDEIAPLGPLTLEIRLPKRPRHIWLQPEGRSLAFKWKQGKATVIVRRLAIHSILEIA